MMTPKNCLAIRRLPTPTIHPKHYLICGYSLIKMFVPVTVSLLTDLIMETITTEPSVLLVLVLSMPTYWMKNLMAVLK